MDTLPLATVKARLSELVERVVGQQDRVTVTRNGRPVAVLVSPDDLDSLEETLAVLSDSQALADIREAREELARGEGVELDELAARYPPRRR
ncbi:MAG: type II toxin-antitoxin system Phd/YefM family antitoxin [Solirubrobacteraceae bacterium]